MSDTVRNGITAIMVKPSALIRLRDEKHDGNLSALCRELGINQTQLHKYMKQESVPLYFEMAAAYVLGIRLEDN